MNQRLGAVACTLVAFPALWIGPHSTERSRAAPAPISWAALGDSYSSGEGNGDSFGPCAVSQNAYAVVAGRELKSQGWPIDPFGFGACTGNVTSNLFNTSPGGQPSQWENVRQQTGIQDRFDIVTMSIGGNDIGFSSVIKSCLNPFSTCTSSDEVLARIQGMQREYQSTSCDRSQDLLRLHDPSGSYQCPLVIDETAGVQGGLVELYSYIASSHLTQRGKLYVVGYPKLFTDHLGWWDDFTDTCYGVREPSRLNALAQKFNEVISSAVRQANQVIGRNAVVYVDRQALFAQGNHSLCGDGGQWLNGISLFHGDDFYTDGSFHPNTAGSKATGALVEYMITHSFDPSAPADETLSATDAAVRKFMNSPYDAGDGVIVPLVDGHGTTKVGSSTVAVTAMAFNAGDVGGVDGDRVVTVGVTGVIRQPATRMWLVSNGTLTESTLNLAAESVPYVTNASIEWHDPASSTNAETFVRARVVGGRLTQLPITFAGARDDPGFGVYDAFNSLTPTTWALLESGLALPDGQATIERAADGSVVVATSSDCAAPILGVLTAGVWTAGGAPPAGQRTVVGSLQPNADYYPWVLWSATPENRTTC